MPGTTTAKSRKVSQMSVQVNLNQIFGDGKIEKFFEGGEDVG